ncbi:3'-5' exonuclease family protein [Rhodococcus rhodochrous]|uniref:hypothetical protein n=1 Tax=Rhodococcus rhodochrous TaxID=1829 RepID=UPI001780F7E2|nr:hypothetical protein [Rhodococcus rhodochrous]QOH55230.1 hypothetical protein C6Y44_04025 [Rhodococcus rhodochrous]
MTNRPIVFLDTETNGLHADRRPWEIAWIRREVDGTETERCIQIADIDNTNAELKGLQVGRFHERFKGGPKASWSLTVDTTLVPRDRRTLLLEVDAAIDVERATRDAIIVGVVPHFDTEVLAAMLRRHRLCPPWHQLVDVQVLAAGWLTSSNWDRIPDTEALDKARQARYAAEQKARKVSEVGTPAALAAAELEIMRALDAENRELRKAAAEFVAPPWRSDELSRACGIEPPTEDERHTALGDARWVKRWYDHIMGGAA